MAALWRADLDVAREAYHPACSVHLPGFRTAYGHEGLYGFMIGYLSAFHDAKLVIEHSIARDDPGLPTRVATRWWLTGTHTGTGAFGAPSGATILALGISHAHVVGGRIREGMGARRRGRPPQADSPAARLIRLHADAALPRLAGSGGASRPSRGTT
jgi:hypothetical protein